MVHKKRTIPLLPSELTDSEKNLQLEAIYSEMFPEGLKLLLEELAREIPPTKTPSEGDNPDKPPRKARRKKI